MKNIMYIILGTFLGIVLYKSEAASWFRIYEMFQFDSFHMYGIIGSALAVGVILVFWIKKSKVKSFSGEIISIPDKEKTIGRGMSWTHLYIGRSGLLAYNSGAYGCCSRSFCIWYC